MTRPIAEIGKVISSREISANLWDFLIEAPQISLVTKAGQFAHVRVSDGFLPLLRRPLSIGPLEGDCMRLIFHVRGEGTKLLAGKKPGDPVDLIGPLGHPIVVPDAYAPIIFLTGGIGVVPLLILDDQLPSTRERIFILGVRSTKTSPITLDEAGKRNILWASDDGSIGFHGNTVQLLDKVISTLSSNAKPMVIACGPTPMLAGMKQYCAQMAIPSQVSLEVTMGCGVGACQSCAVPRSDGKGYYLVCKDGPVFNTDSVLLDPREMP